VGTGRWGWIILYVVVQAFNLTSVIAGIRGVALAMSDEDYRNGVLYGALILNTVLLVVGLRIAARVRPRFANPS